MDPAAQLRYLYRRAGFGATAGQVAQAAANGFEATVDELLAGLGDAADPSGDAVAVPAFSAPSAVSRAAAPPGSPARKQLDAAYLAETVALQDWWFDRMIVTDTPLREKLTLFWHGHFATGLTKVRDPAWMYRQNQLFRAQGGGSFEQLTLAVAQDPAMMRWLDTVTDLVAHPNENFARELMELFTLGLGNYTQADVVAAARAFTGWAFDRTTGDFVLRQHQHDQGTKTFLGHTGNLGGADVVAVICHQPASARFVAASVWSHFAYPVTPADPVVDDLVAAYGPGLDLTALVRAVLLHPQFLAPAATGGLVKQPIELLAGAARSLGLDARLRRADGVAGSGGGEAGVGGGGGPGAGLRLAAIGTQLGQTMFNPPNVAGWPQNAYWLNTATALARLRAGRALAERADLSDLQALPAGQRVAATAELLGVDPWGPAAAAALAHVAGDPVSLVALALSAPEYVLA